MMKRIYWLSRHTTWLRMGGRWGFWPGNWNTSMTFFSEKLNQNWKSFLSNTAITRVGKGKGSILKGWRLPSHTGSVISTAPQEKSIFRQEPARTRVLLVRRREKYS